MFLMFDGWLEVAKMLWVAAKEVIKEYRVVDRRFLRCSSLNVLGGC